MLDFLSRIDEKYGQLMLYVLSPEGSMETDSIGLGAPNLGFRMEEIETIRGNLSSSDAR